MIDPHGFSAACLASLRRRGSPVFALSSRRLEPVLYARGLHTMRVESLETHPTEALARLLELAGHLDRRALLLAFSDHAVTWLRQHQSTLAPHYESPLFTSQTMSLLDFPAAEVALRRNMCNRKPAFDVQMTLDRQRQITSAHVLAWTCTAPPYVLAASIAGRELLERSRQWVCAHSVHGFIRLVFAANRFGRIELQGMSPYPHASWELAAAEGVDLLSYWYASAFAIPLSPPSSVSGNVHRLAMLEPENGEDPLPVVLSRVRWDLHHPMSSLVSFIASLVRRYL